MSSQTPASAEAVPPTSVSEERREPDIGARLADWAALVRSLNIGGIASQLAAHSVFAGWNDGELTLSLDPANQTLRTAMAEERLRKTLSEHLGGEIRLRIDVVAPQTETPAQLKAREDEQRQRKAVAAFEADSLVKAAGEKLGARPVPETIAPTKG